MPLFRPTRSLLLSLLLMAPPALAQQRQVWKIPVPYPDRGRVAPSGGLIFYQAKWDAGTHTIVAVVDDELVRIDPLKRKWTVLAKVPPPRPHQTGFRRCPVRALAVDRHGVVDYLQMLPIGEPKEREPGQPNDLELSHHRLTPGGMALKLDPGTGGGMDMIDERDEQVLTFGLIAGPKGERYFMEPNSVRQLPAPAAAGPAEAGQKAAAILIRDREAHHQDAAEDIPRFADWYLCAALGTNTKGEAFVLIAHPYEPSNSLLHLVPRQEAAGTKWTAVAMAVLQPDPSAPSGWVEAELPMSAKLVCADDGRLYLLPTEGDADVDNILELEPRPQEGGRATLWHSRALLKTGSGATPDGPFPMPVDQFKPTAIHDLDALPGGGLLLTTPTGLFFVDPSGERSLAGRVQAFKDLRAGQSEAAAQAVFAGVLGWVRPTGRLSGRPARNHDGILAGIATGGLAQASRAALPGPIQAEIASYLLDPTRQSLPAALALLAMDPDLATRTLWPSAAGHDQPVPSLKRQRISDQAAPELGDGLALEEVD